MKTITLSSTFTVQFESPNGECVRRKVHEIAQIIADTRHCKVETRAAGGRVLNVTLPKDALPTVSIRLSWKSNGR